MYGTPIAHDAKEKPQIEAYFPGDIAANLRRMTTLLVYQKHLPPRLSIIASLRREGVTYVTLAMAAVLANDLNKRVCAVELNWQAPGMLAQCLRLARPKATQAAPQFFGSATQHTDAKALQPGLADVLRGEVPLEKAIYATALPGLSIVPAGEMPIHEQPLQARSEALRTLIDHLETQFDQLVFDLPAVVASSDAIALAPLGSACCIVIRQGVTHLNTVRRALDEIKHLNVLGVIMNRVQIHTPQLLRNFIPQE